MTIYEVNGGLWNPDAKEWLMSNEGFRVVLADDIDWLRELGRVLLHGAFQHTCESPVGFTCDACDAIAVWEAACLGKDAEDARARIEATPYPLPKRPD